MSPPLKIRPPHRLSRLSFSKRFPKQQSKFLPERIHCVHRLKCVSPTVSANSLTPARRSERKLYLMEENEMRRTFLQSGLMLAALFMISSTGATAQSTQREVDPGERRELRADRREIRADTRDIRSDRRDIRGDVRDRRGDVREYREDKREGASQQELRADRREIRADTHEIRADRRDLRVDRRDRRGDRRDYHRDRRRARRD